jgi:acyl carrier protein
MAADGSFRFEGRSDDLVKVHGVRVSLGEIEAALRSHPGVRDAAVLLCEDAAAGARIHAFIEPSSTASTASMPTGDHQALRRFLREHHPDCVVPHVITWHQNLPRTASGKIDRPALRLAFTSTEAAKQHPGVVEDMLPSSAVRPIDRVEAIVRDAWISTLGVDLVDGDFFELGGDSLQVISMLGHITTALGVDIPLIAAFFGNPTLLGLVEVIQKGAQSPPHAPLVGLPRIPRRIT